MIFQLIVPTGIVFIRVKSLLIFSILEIMTIGGMYRMYYFNNQNAVNMYNGLMKSINNSHKKQEENMFRANKNVEEMKALMEKGLSKE